MWHTSRVITSNVPRQRPNCPRTPASSRTSRRAVTAGSSSGSTPPPGTIQLSGLRLDVTSSTCKFTVHVRDLARDNSSTSTRRIQVDQRSGEKSTLGEREREGGRQREKRLAGSSETRATTACRQRYRWLPSASWLTSSSRSLLTQIQAALRLYPSES